MRLTRPALLFLGAWLCLSLPASALVGGSVHDFSSNGWSGGKICVVCHIPHQADASVSDAPLWNHEIGSATYTPYSSPTMSAVPGQPRGPSKLCLSCHDVHNGSGFPYLLNMPKSGSVLCLWCHGK